MEADRDPLSDLEPYVSPAHRRFVLRSRGTLGPDAEVFRAVALFADISGFSALTAALSARGAGGAEELSTILNDRFGRLVDLVHLHGGELLDFAGDAAIAYWRIDDEASRVARRAAQCGLAIRNALEGDAGTGGMPIRLRIGIGAGQVLSALVGGTDGRWHTLMGGEAWTEMLRADASARPGQVVLAPSVQRLVDEPDDGASPAPRPVLDAPRADGLRAGVPRAVQKRLDAGQRGWLGEFLTITTCFVNVPALRYDSEDRLNDLHGVTSAMQAVVHRFGGSVNRLLADDKGTVLIAAWGVPLHTYEDNAARATLASLTIREDLRVLGVRPAIGVTTGRAFAGPVGNSRRRQYALLGDSINLAARLMQSADDEVLCDTPTRAAARSRVLFGPARTVRVKGRDDAVDAGAALSARARGPSRDIVGRDAEEGVLNEALAGVEQRGDARLVIISGEPGIGKSRLVSAFLRRAQASSVRVLIGTGESIDRLSPYHVWRGVFDTLLGLDESDFADARLRKVSAVMGQDPLFRFAPLLNDTLGYSLAQTELTSTISREARAEATRDFLAQLFRRTCGNAPSALVLEDAHWIDSASWSLASAIQRTSERLLLVLVIRPMEPEDMSEDCRRLLTHERARVLDLQVLPRDEVVTLACRRLDVDSLPEAVADLIRDRAEGHPLFTEQLVQALLERGVIRVVDHECRADPTLVIPEFPETVQGLIRSRIDLLSPEEQLTLKVASIFGRVIDVPALFEVHPLRRAGTLEPQLARMARLDLLQAVPGRQSAPGPVYAFKHAIVQEVAYGTLSFAQRRELHRGAAQWYEGTLEDVPSAYPLLARHWSQAGDTEQSLLYLQKAGEQALHTGSYREAVTFFTQALATGKDASRELVPKFREAVWLRQLGQACYALGKLGDARAHLELAAATLGFPIPASRWRQVGIAVGVLLFGWTRRLRPRVDAKIDASGARMYEAAVVLNAVSAIYYLDQDARLTVYSIARKFDLVDRLQPTDLLVRFSAEMAFLWEFAGIRRQADRLFEQGWATAQALRAPLTSARVLFSWSVLDLGRGAFSRGQARARESAAIYREFGENTQRRDSELVEAFFATFTGPWDEGAARYERLLAESRAQENLVHIGWACHGLAKIRHRQARFDDAFRCIEEGLAAAEEGGDRTTELNLIGTRALVRIAAGDIAGGALDVHTAGQRIDPKSVPSSFLATDGFAAVAEAAFALLARDDHGSERGQLDLAASTACIALRRGARVFPAARPALLLWSGVYHSVHGRNTRAARCWRAALTDAERLGLPYEAGLIRGYLSR